MIPEQTLLGFPLFGDNATKVEPDNNKKSNGWQQGDVVPAEWMNWEWYHASKGVADLNKGVSSMEKEIIAVLTEYGIVPAEATEDQLKSVLLKMRPQICECLTAASTAAKSVSLSGNVLKAGNIYVITMTNGNTAANPTLSFNSGTAYPMCNADGVALGRGAWKAGDTITVLFTGAKYLMATIAVTEKIENGNTSPVTSNAVSCVISDDPNPTVLTGPELGVGANFKVLFKAAISASDTTTPLSLTYNGTAYTVKARKDGALVNVLGHETATNIYKYLQAYTAIEFVFDGTNLIIMGNPVLLSDTDYTIYSNGKSTVNVVEDGNMNSVTSNAVAESFGEWVSVFNSGATTIKGIETKNGKYLALHVQGIPSTHSQTIGRIADPKYIPQSALYVPCVDTAFLYIRTDGSIIAYNGKGGTVALYCDAIVLFA